MKLGDYLGAGRSNVTPSILEFKSIDADAMIKRMRLVKLADERGSANQPATESCVPRFR